MLACLLVKLVRRNVNVSIQPGKFHGDVYKLKLFTLYPPELSCFHAKILQLLLVKW